ncbi:hypothetical protein AYI75_14265 [Shewanella algae]|uniref:DUF2254 domain-containing protein n=1 Tax=Shewanella algae TaxID=38313 RepID=UPI0011A380DE|nr:DUF2254 domain-containing protein [Shewanella algae]TWO83676.1 hypothetical protein AYI75_14265 [Shewanella algae]
MLSKWGWRLLQLSRKLWMRTVLFAILAVVTALLAIVVQGVIPPSLSGMIGADAVDKLLNILASSMLAVTTFSLSVMISAYGAATSNISPRATKLLMEDSTAQQALATFVGSFVFSIVGIIALSTGVYGEEGRVVLFLVTVAVVVLIVATILVWINHLSKLGRVGETTDRIEKAAGAAIQRRCEHPRLDGRRLASDEDIPKGALALYPADTGYVQHVDLGSINQWAEDYGAEAYITSLPGAFVHQGRPLLWLSFQAEDGGVDDAQLQPLHKAFTVANERSFDQDPRFGLSVLAEVASRALSAAVNDPGTAIDVIGRGVRLIAKWQVTDEQNLPAPEAIPYPRVWMLPIRLEELFDDFFMPIARDGAALVEIHIRLQKAFQALSNRVEFSEVCRKHSELALARAEQVLTFEPDVTLLRKLAAELQQEPSNG